MRIIAGALKGRHLKAPTWDGLRPTSDKLRETLFNILAPRVPGARVLDGYAGTGAVGIEALSRGASHVTFVERDRRAQALIAENLARCGVSDGCAIIRASVEGALTPARSIPFDVVFLDPPYEADPAQVAAVLAAFGERLADDGILVLEHARRAPAAASAGRLVRTRTVTSGDSALSLYQQSTAQERS